MIYAERYHDISCGHRVHGHENKCAWLHGHNYRVHFLCEGEPDRIGRVLDFGVIKAKLCMWLEDNWDHRFLAWERDTSMRNLVATDLLEKSIVWLPFNPTAENMALYLLYTIGPRQLEDTHVRLIEVKVEETRKCSAVARLDRSVFDDAPLGVH